MRLSLIRIIATIINDASTPCATESFARCIERIQLKLLEDTRSVLYVRSVRVRISSSGARARDVGQSGNLEAERGRTVREVGQSGNLEAESFGNKRVDSANQGF